MKWPNRAGGAGRAVDRQILAIAAPAFLALVSEPLMLLADTSIVGRVGTAELGGLAIASTVLLTVTGLCIFLAYGSTARVGRLAGAERRAEALGVAVSTLWLAVAVGLVGAAIVGLGAPWLAGAFGSSAEVTGHAVTYLRISATAVPALLVLLAGTGALRGLLDLRTPLIVTVAANLANIGLSLAFVHGLDLGIAGAALGTVLAQWAGAIWLTIVLARLAFRASASRRPRWRGVLAAARDGGPLLVRTVALRAALLLATAVAAGLGTVPLAAHQVATTVVSVLAFALDAIAIAGQTLTGRTLGGGEPEVTRALVRRMMGWGLVIGALAGLLVAASAPWLPALFSPDTAVQAALVPVLLVVAVLQPVSGVVFVLDGVLIGAGDGRYLAAASVITLAVYAPLALSVLPAGGGLVWLWWAYGALQAARLATLWWRERGGRWMVLGA